MKSKSFILSALVALAGFLPQSKAALYLGAADSFAVLAGTGITVNGPTTITGDIGTYPTTTITVVGSFTLNGVNHAGDAVTQQAQTDAHNAYTTLAGEKSNPGSTDLSGQNLGIVGTLTPGVYYFNATAQLTGTLTLDAGGDPNARFDFLIGTALGTAVNSSVSLINGAQAGNVFWQVGSSATLLADTRFYGSILADQSITFDTGASMSGRALALNAAVTLDGNEITAVPEAAAFWPLVFCASVFGAGQWLAVWRRQQAGRS